MTLTDILHIRQVVTLVEHRDAVAGLLTPAQQTKLDTIESLLADIGTVGLDEELEATIAELTEIRDRVNP